MSEIKDSLDRILEESFKIQKYFEDDSHYQYPDKEDDMISAAIIIRNQVYKISPKISEIEKLINE